AAEEGGVGVAGGGLEEGAVLPGGVPVVVEVGDGGDAERFRGFHEGEGLNRRRARGVSAVTRPRRRARSPLSGKGGEGERERAAFSHSPFLPLPSPFPDDLLRPAPRPPRRPGAVLPPRP